MPWISTLLARAGASGRVTAVRRASGAARQPRDTWRAGGRAAVAASVAPVPVVPALPALARSILTLLAAVAEPVPIPVPADRRGRQRHLTAAVPGLLTFATGRAPVPQTAPAARGAAGAPLLAQLPAAWRPAAAVLVLACDRAGRARSTGAGGARLLRPHAAVHRPRSPALLALLAVWHNHRGSARDPQAGHRPRHRRGVTAAPAAGGTALDAPPAAPRPTPRPLPVPQVVRRGA